MRRSQFGALLLMALTLAAPEAASAAFSNSQSCLSDPLPTTPTAPVVTAMALGSLLELWRIPCDADPTSMGALLRITPIDAPFPLCTVPITFTLDDDPPFGVGGSGTCTLDEPQTLAVHASSPHFFIVPNREALAIQVQGTTVLSLPALSAPLMPMVFISSSGCRPCTVGQAATLFALVGNPRTESILAEARTSVAFPDGGEVVLWGPGVLVEVPPGDSVIPLLNEFIVSADIPPGPYYFGVTLLDPETGFRIGDPARFRIDRNEQLCATAALVIMART